jgi:excinuclease ABC subunit B
MYADSITRSMKAAITETERRRKIQNDYNQAHGIVPKTIVKGVRDIIEIGAADEKTKKGSGKLENESKLTAAAREKLIEDLTAEMKSAARKLEFEQAAYLRDRIKKLREGKVDTAKPIRSTKKKR